MKKTITTGPLETAVRLLARRDHSEREMINKLKQIGHSSDEISLVIEQLRQKGYIDDAKIKRQTIEKLVSEQHYGLRMLVGKLRLKGLTVSSEEIRQFLSREEEWKTAEKLVDKRFKSWDAENYPKIARFLNNRGFSQEVLSQMAENASNTAVMPSALTLL